MRYNARMGRAIILVLDSFGIGATTDAEKFGDAGANTLGHIAERRAATSPLNLPNLAKLGLLHAGEIAGLYIIMRDITERTRFE
jgi:phosphopentomutase